MVPAWNLATIIRSHFPQKKWFLTLLALPVNLFLVWFILDIPGVWSMLSETIKLGVSPFVLSRNEFSDNAIFLFPDYVGRITAQRLNPLLKNYWMVIHPPTLFLGFGLTLVPLAFAISGIANQRYSDWIKPALPWVITATMVLGTGILMGGMWAYEALSFGGFWAWDPVENASLVPWLTLIAGMHTLLIFKNTGRAMKTTMVFFLISVFLVLYSTFLTRSGILGDASVHSFTDLGMQGQLLVLIIAMMLPAIILFAIHWHKLPAKEKEEKFSSREFWMFIGSLVFLFSAIHIIFSTSLPVFNKITAGVNELLGTDFQANYALPKDQVGFYNNVQVWVGILIAFLTGAVQYLKYKSTNLRRWVGKIALPILAALIITAILEYVYQFYSFAFVLLLFTGLFTIISNAEYTITALRGSLRKSGSTIAHIGFGLTMAFIVISLGESQVISKNYLNIDFGKNFDEDFKQNNLYLLQDQTYFMDEYEVTYEGREVKGEDYYFKVHYKKVNPETGQVTDSFTLKPHILHDPNMGLVPNPSTAKFLDKDIFTHVSSIPTAGEGSRPRELPDVTMERIGIGDSFFTSRGVVRFEGMNRVENIDTAVAVVAQLTVDDTRNKWSANPMFLIRGNEFISVPDTLEHQKLIFEVADIDPQSGTWSFKVTDHNDWIIMKALVFPWINLLWLGVALMMAGFLISIVYRIREYNRIKTRETS
jgi:cytochrome c-type biogenesis protein CcmF